MAGGTVSKPSTYNRRFLKKKKKKVKSKKEGE